MYRFTTIGPDVSDIVVYVFYYPPPLKSSAFHYGHTHTHNTHTYTHTQHTHTHTHTHIDTGPAQLDDMEIQEADPLPGQVGGGVSVIDIAQTNTDSSTSAETDARGFTTSRAHYVYST